MPNMPRTEPNDAVPVRLTDRERHLILNETKTPAHLINRLRIVIVRESGAEVYYTLDELEDLLKCVATATQKTKNTHLREELSLLYDKLERLFDLHLDQVEESLESDEEIPGFLKNLPVDLLEELKDRLSNAEFTDIDDLNNQVGEVFMKYNSRPMEDMGGLTPSQVFRIVGSDWDDEAGPVRFNDKLTASDLAGVPIFENARILLSAILDSGTVKATKKKNLTRKFVERMLNAMVLPEGYLETFWKYSKVADEIYVKPLNVLRIVAELAQLIECGKGGFQVTEKGRNLLADERAGALYVTLFKTFFGQFNLGYLDQIPELDGVQTSVPYSLYMIARNGKEWLSPEDFADLVLLPAAKDEIDALEQDIPREWPVLSRLVAPLTQEFGLLEREAHNDKLIHYLDSQIRKTPLFDRFLSFNLS